MTPSLDTRPSRPGPVAAAPTGTGLVVTDPLTGLQNRAGLADLARRAAARAARGGHDLTVLVVDLEGFEAIGGTHRHDAGDEVLVACAERLTGAVRATDVVARSGGERFVVLAEGIDRTAARTIASRVREAVSTPIVLEDGCVVAVGAGVGTANGRADEDLHAVMVRAGAATSRAAGGRTRVTPY